jgi:hypothetical protein
MDPGLLPKLRNGLWVTTVTSEGMRPATHSICMDEATQQRLLTMGLGMAAGMCAKTSLRREGEAVVFGSDCSIGPMRVKTTGRTTFTGDAAYSSESTTSFDPPMMGRGAMHSSVKGRHTGACPAGMNPGDMKLPDGRVMNINSLPSMMMPPR